MTGVQTCALPISFLVTAFGRSGAECDLVLAGRASGSLDRLRSAIAASPVAGRVRLVPDATDRDIEALYRRAIALVLPSRYEGFGFPPLEAMARGCPVLASDIPALREISSPGALLLPLDDAEAWAQAMRRVSEDEQLRTELREKGTETVARYSWDETGRGLCRLFAEVAAEMTG